MQEFQKTLDEYLTERDWKDTTSPDYLAKSISIESAELLELFQNKAWTSEEILNDEELLQNIKDELGDVVILAAQMAMKLDGDLLDFAKEKLEKAKKKYPVEIVKGNSDAYYQIKQQHRAQK